MKHGTAWLKALMFEKEGDKRRGLVSKFSAPIPGPTGSPETTISGLQETRRFLDIIWDVL